MIEQSASMLYESVKPSVIDYGTNDTMDDGDIAITTMFVETSYTFFEYDSLYYCVSFQKVPTQFIQNRHNIPEYDLGFGVSLTPSLNYHDYDDVNIPTKKAISLFGKIIYVAAKIVEYNTSISVISFSGSDKKFKVYQTMLNNTPLKKAIEDQLKFRYDGIHGDSIIMVRI